MLRTVIRAVLIGFGVWSGNFCPNRADEISTRTASEVLVRPAQIIVGSLVFGSYSDSLIERRVVISGLRQGESVTRIDMSHAQGIRVLDQHDILDGTMIDLGIDPIEFSEKEPYGSFIKRLIRIETSSSTEPQLIVPVMGWLDINKTSRDFNRYLFDGTLRWQGSWATPNIAGAVIAPLLLLLLGAWTWVATHWKRGFPWINVTVLAILTTDALILLVLLGLTYSRGSWAAFFSGCVFLACSATLLRRTALGALTVFVLLLLLLPSGLHRMTTSTHLEDDLSVANRLRLWTGALQMMAEHPWRGVGSGQFGNVFEKDYQEYRHTAKNSTAVSDVFTFGAEHGLLALGIIVGFLVFVAVVSFRNALSLKSIIQMTITAALVAILATSIFSTLWFVRDYQVIFASVLLALLGLLVIPYWNGNQGMLKAKRSLIRLSITILFVVFALGFISAFTLCLLPTRLEIETSKVQGFHTFDLIKPRWSKPLGTILYFSKAENKELLYHAVIRPLAAKGWDIIPVLNSGNLQNEAQFLGFLHQTFPKQPLFVAGEEQGGREAWELIAREPKELICAGGGFEFLSMDLDPKYGARAISRPFFVYQSLYDDHVSANAAIIAQKQAAFRRLPLTIVLSSGEIGSFGPGQAQALQTFSDFFRKSARE